MENVLFNELLASVQEMNKIVQEEMAAAKVTEFPKPDTRSFRKKTDLSQSQFAK